MTFIKQNEFGSLQQITLSPTLQAIEIVHKTCTAKVSFYGGQVLSWQPKGEKEIFWVSKKADYEQGKAIRGGIPICWPWFGVHPQDHTKSAGNHGVARQKIWQLREIEINEQGVELTLTWQSESTHSLWPFSAQLTQVLFFGNTFKQSLIIRNNSNQRVYYTGALHSYFKVSNPKNIAIDKLGESSFDDQLTGQLCSAQFNNTELANGTDCVDRIYHSNDTMKIIDAKWQRAIEITTKNTKQWVFWNPGIDIASNMADIHPEGEQEFICLEAANTNEQLIEAGQSVAMSQHISVSSVRVP